MHLIHDTKSLIGRMLRSVHAGDQKLINHLLPQPPTATITMGSAAFQDGAAIPRRHSAEGENISPPIWWSGVPVSAAELILLCQDPDVPFPSPFMHWIVYGLNPGHANLPEGVSPQRHSGNLCGAIQADNSKGTPGYTGPMPPIGHGVHHYHFELFAVDKSLRLSDKPGRDELIKVLSGHVVAQGELVGTYERV